MKLRILLFCLSGFLWLGCSEDSAALKEEENLILPENNLTLSGEQQTKKVVVLSNTDWKITGEADWLTFDKTTGKGNDTVSVTVNINFDRNPRSVDLYVEGGEISERLMIEQEAYIYRLPVIFHVLYADAADTLQNLKAERIYEMVGVTNALYRNREGNTTDILTELVPAETTPDGKPLAEAGIERIVWPYPAMDDHEFCQSSDPEYLKLLWDLNSYINVFVFTFTKEGEPGTHSGVAFSPYTTSDAPLEGLMNGDYYVKNPDIRPNYMHGICLNNANAYSNLSKVDLRKTLAHEVGHYLGLHHAFSQSDCADTDYCDDTPNYNRDAYEAWYSMNAMKGDSVTCKRTSCEGNIFNSTNIMDYFVSSRDKITPDQFKRVRHCLVHSPLLPGPKMPHNLSGTKGADVRPLPSGFME